jgi:hypothetical protein
VAEIGREVEREREREREEDRRQDASERVCGDGMRAMKGWWCGASGSSI